MELLKNLLEPTKFCNSYKKESNYLDDEILKGFDKMCSKKSCFLSSEIKQKLDVIKLKILTLKGYAAVNSLKTENILNFFKKEPTDVLICMCKSFNIDFNQLLDNISNKCILDFVDNLITVYVKSKNKYTNEQHLPEVELKHKEREYKMISNAFYDLIECVSKNARRHKSYLTLKMFICILLLCLLYIIYFVVRYYKKEGSLNIL